MASEQVRDCQPSAKEGGFPTHTRNRVGVLTAEGPARVHVGNSTTTIINQVDKKTVQELRKKFISQLRTTDYEDRKDRNPQRAEGTCQWFTSHDRFQHWQQETSALLWVSADPGCGKSVLSRYLIDELFPSDEARTRTTCYFFFKDDFDDQKTVEGALCCILHQLYTQKPELLPEEVLADYEEAGDHIFKSFRKLWDILLGAADLLTKATDQKKHGEIICVLDALDECSDAAQLTEGLTKLYQQSKGLPIKFLVTSRPYLQIRQKFNKLEKSHPTIHLSGENQEEADAIAREIAITIDQRIKDLCEQRQFSSEEEEILQQEVAKIHHRTYLWAHLVFAQLEQVQLFSKDEIRSAVRSLPHTVEEAYDKILRNTRDRTKSMKILRIIVAAYRPLQITELAVILALQESDRHFEDIKILEPDRLFNEVREACGLFVIMHDSRILLLHQTAREFLIRQQPKPSEARSLVLARESLSLEWQYSLDMKEAHQLFAGISMRYLLLGHSDPTEGNTTSQEAYSQQSLALLDYAAGYWAIHYRQASTDPSGALEGLALKLCRSDSPMCLRWLRIFGESCSQWSDFDRELPTSLHIGCFFGLEGVVEAALREKESLEVRSAVTWRTALSWACDMGYTSIVKMLLETLSKPRIILGRSSRFPTIVNLTDQWGSTPLSFAVSRGHTNIVHLLLSKRALVNLADADGLTPLLRATLLGYNDIVELLLRNGAQQSSLETKERHGQTPLVTAAMRGDEFLVRLLLDFGADVESLDKLGATALQAASSQGHEATVRLLLDRGTDSDIEALSGYGNTALDLASEKKHKAVVRLLRDRMAKIGNQ